MIDSEKFEYAKKVLNTLDIRREKGCKNTAAELLIEVYLKDGIEIKDTLLRASITDSLYRRESGGDYSYTYEVDPVDYTNELFAYLHSLNMEYGELSKRYNSEVASWFRSCKRDDLKRILKVHFHNMKQEEIGRVEYND